MSAISSLLTPDASTAGRTTPGRPRTGTAAAPGQLTNFADFLNAAPGDGEATGDKTGRVPGKVPAIGDSDAVDSPAITDGMIAALPGNGLPTDAATLPVGPAFLPPAAKVDTPALPARFTDLLNAAPNPVAPTTGKTAESQVQEQEGQDAPATATDDGTASPVATIEPASVPVAAALMPLPTNAATPGEPVATSVRTAEASKLAIAGKTGARASRQETATDSDADQDDIATGTDDAADDGTDNPSGPALSTDTAPADGLGVPIIVPPTPQMAASPTTATGTASPSDTTLSTNMARADGVRSTVIMPLSVQTMASPMTTASPVTTDIGRDAGAPRVMPDSARPTDGATGAATAQQVEAASVRPSDPKILDLLRQGVSNGVSAPSSPMPTTATPVSASALASGGAMPAFRFVAASAQAPTASSAPPLASLPSGPLTVTQPGRGTATLGMLAGALRGLSSTQTKDEESRDSRTPVAATGIAAASLGATDLTRSVTATNATDQAPLDMTQQHWPQAMIDRIDRIDRMREDAATADTRIQLSPDALGGIAVAIRHSEGATHIHFTAEQSSTATILADAHHTLNQLAEDKGMRLGDVAVSAGSTTGSDLGQSARDQRAPAQPVPVIPNRPRGGDPEPSGEDAAASPGTTVSSPSIRIA